MRGAVGVSKTLLLAGANPNLQDRQSGSPLHFAAAGGHDDLVSDLLLKSCADAVAAGMKNTPLHLAAANGHVVCASRLLLGGAAKDSLDGSGSTPLISAVRNGHPGVVEELVSAGATCCVRDELGWTALELAANTGNADVLRALLLRDGVELNRVDDGSGCTPLNFAAEARGTDRDKGGDAIRRLLGAGADIEAKTSDSVTLPLMKDLTNIRTLLEGGADVNTVDADESTPLHSACAQSSVAAVELLLRWGADEALTDVNRLTAAEVVGRSEEDDSTDDDDDNRDAEGKRRMADNQRIRQMLARDPGNRPWRRRGWLILCRSSQAKVRLANDSTRSGISVKAAKASGQHSDLGDVCAEDQSTINFGRLLGEVVEVDPEGVFRLIVGFL